jgi:hypothetical protein
LSSGLRKSAAGFRLPGTTTEPSLSSTSTTGTFRRVEEGKTPARPVSVAGGS